MLVFGGGVFRRLLPVLPVVDVDAEVGFYAALGFTAEVTYSGFTSLRCGPVLFGVQKPQGMEHRVPPWDLAWQIEVSDVHAVHDLAVRRGLKVVSEPQPHPAGFWTVQLRTPNGYCLILEGPPGAGPRS
ncbi:VOC family protein [Streptomyces sp. NPDC052811]|uniref:VOC family protein n=1 Tax=Streptomyces sp. NPDC052811 TaxID=3155731 RepID=UPI0034355A32